MSTTATTVPKKATTATKATKATTATTATPTTATTIGANISTSLLLASILGVIAMFCVIGLFAAKDMLGVYFSLLYYIVYPAVIYLIAVGFNAITQQGTCNSVTNITNCFTGAAYTLGYLYATMVAVNLIGPNGIFTFEPEEPPIINMSQSAPPPLSTNENITKNEETGRTGRPSAPPPLPQGPDEILQKGSDDVQKNPRGENMNKKRASGATENDPQEVSITNRADSANSTLDNPTNPQGGGKRILRQRGGYTLPRTR